MAETETQEIVVDFGKICRLCLTDVGVLISLYSKDSLVDSQIKSIPEKILDLMAIEVTKDDGFPPWICHNCLSQVQKCSEFIEMCRSSQFTLNESYIKALSEAGVNVSTLKSLFNENDVENVSTILGKQKQDKTETDLEEEEVYSLNCVKQEYETGSGVANGGKSKEDKSRNKVWIKYLCRDCAKMFINRDEFLVHRISVHHDDLVTETTKLDQVGNKMTGLWTCDACGVKFTSRSAMLTHIRSKHLNEEKEVSNGLSKLIFCKYCGSSYSRKHAARHLEIVHKLSKNLDLEQTDMNSFDCKICYRPFMRHSSLRNHIEKCHSENLEMIAEAENCNIVWNCSECDSLFSEEVFLIQHCGNKHSKYPLEVDSLRVLKSKSLICHCGTITSNSFDFFVHDIFYHKEGSQTCPLECPACCEVFTQLDDLKKHLIAFHWFVAPNYNNECTFCCKDFNSNELLRAHLSDDHNIRFQNIPSKEKPTCSDPTVSSEKKPGENETEVTEADAEKNNVSNEKLDSEVSMFVCNTCGGCCDNEEDLQSHLSECQGNHVCDLCGKIYKSEVHFKRHIMEYHNTMSPIKCPLCPKVFPRKMNLHNHYKRRHLKQAKKFVCSYCGISLKGKVALRSHEDRLHRNIRNYKCTECPEAFTTRSILRKHAQRHLAERPMFQCQYCERKFSTISGIERHVKTHEGVKDFVCDLPMCGKSFYTKSELKRHIKFHTKDFRHVCPVCNHKFMSPGELKKHSTKHTGERPFKCHLCSCAYARRDDKVKHLKRVHNLKVKRIYGKPLRKYSNENVDTVDTVVVDEESSTKVNPPEDVLYANIIQ